MSIGTENARDAFSAGSAQEKIREVLGCEWTLLLLEQIRSGTVRPEQLERSVTGIPTNVLNDRLLKLVHYGVLERRALPEIPPRPEYPLSPFGERFTAILDSIRELENAEI